MTGQGVAGFGLARFSDAYAAIRAIVRGITEPRSKTSVVPWSVLRALRVGRQLVAAAGRFVDENLDDKPRGSCVPVS